ncbi:hypothetical protein [Paenibacillus campinasensis]|uniref:Uncharacterized protein n=1 Tax=Paenibacillus campinasensis TaxID=66347 RepID=A0A268EE08_9BACL|nr:hypothetical protein [Paenibacillus campinasensis]PAD71358.1 hypothetical protein CHH67_24750 [Paenibacillus campinasensis]
MSGYITVEELCVNIMKGINIDVFYLINENKGIFKSEIIRKFQQYDPEGNASVSKYRHKVDVAIATLIGAAFIESRDAGRKDQFFLTPYGEEAVKVLGDLLDKDPSILFGSIIVVNLNSIMEG